MKKVILAIVTVPLLVWVVFALVFGGQMALKKRSGQTQEANITKSLPFAKLMRDIGVERVIFKRIKSSGIGPGSIQQTVVLYQLSKEAQNQLKFQGCDYLSVHSQTHPSLITWEFTPIIRTPSVGVRSTPTQKLSSEPIQIRSFLDLPSTVNRQVQEMATEDGNFYFVNKGVTMVVDSDSGVLLLVSTK